MSKYYSLVTNAGKNALISALANHTNINLTTMSVGDSIEPLSASWDALPNEKHKFNINAIYPQEDDPNVLIVEGAITADVGGFAINQVAVFDENGVMFAVAQVPSTIKPLLNEGAAKDMSIRFYLAVENASTINIKVDNSVVLATRKWAQTLIDRKEDKGVAKTLDDALKQEIAGNYLLKTETAADADKLDGLDSTEYHQRNSANPSKVTAVSGNIVDLSRGDNFTMALNSSSVLTLTNPSIGQSGVLIVDGATNISGYSPNISFRIVPSSLNATETFAYFVQSGDVIKMGRV